MALIVQNPVEVVPEPITKIYDKVHLFRMQIELEPTNEAKGRINLIYKLYRTLEDGSKDFHPENYFINIRDIDTYVAKKYTEHPEVLIALANMKDFTRLLIELDGSRGSATII